MVRLVLFDIDGTLIQTGGAGVKAFGRAVETEFNVPNGTASVKFAGRTDTGIARPYNLSVEVMYALDSGMQKLVRIDAERRKAW